MEKAKRCKQIANPFYVTVEVPKRPYCRKEEIWKGGPLLCTTTSGNSDDFIGDCPLRAFKEADYTKCVHIRVSCPICLRATRITYNATHVLVEEIIDGNTFARTYSYDAEEYPEDQF